MEYGRINRDDPVMVTFTERRHMTENLKLLKMLG